MKFSATFAVLAVFVTNAVVVSAAPIAPAYDASLEARADLAEGAFEEVWARLYDGLLDETEEREYDDDVFESREYDEEIYERAPMKKFIKDVGSNLGQNAHGYAKQHTQHHNAQIRQSQPRAPFVVNHKTSPPSSSHGHSHGSSGSGKKRSFDFDEEIFERAPMKKFAKDVGSNLAQNAHGYAKQHTQQQNGQIRQSQPRAPFVANHKTSPPSSSHGHSHGSSGSGKKRSFDLDIFERAPMKKFAKDVGSNLAQNAHGYAKQHTQQQNGQIRQSQPRAPFVVNHKTSPPSSSHGHSHGSSHGSSGKKRSFDMDEEIFERAPMKKFMKDVGSNLGQNAHGYAKQHTQHHNAQIRQSLPRAPFVVAHKTSPPSVGHGHSHGGSGKKRSLDIEEEALEDVL